MSSFCKINVAAVHQQHLALLITFARLLSSMNIAIVIIKNQVCFQPAFLSAKVEAELEYRFLTFIQCAIYTSTYIIIDSYELGWETWK